MAKQISVFVENKPGKLMRITEVLEDSGINLRAVTISDSGDYGIIKLLVDKPQEGCDALKADGLAATLKDIVAVKLQDRPGGLRGATTVLAQNGVNIDDAYGFILKGTSEAVFVFQVEHVQKTESLLKEAGFEVVADRDLYLL